MGVKNVFIGTAGFSFPHWRGGFYPAHLPQSSWLKFYSGHFSSIELNVTFYRPPTIAMIRRWLDQVPPSFRFTIKANREITHEKRLVDCYDNLRSLWRDLVPFNDALSCVLFQIPPSLYLDLERFKQFKLDLDSTRPDDVNIAIEFRHHSWYVPQVLSLLASGGYSVVLHDIAGRGGFSPLIREGLPDQLIGTGTHRLKVTDWINYGSQSALYLRMHGVVNNAFHSEYGDRLIRPWARVARQAMERGIPLYIYFSNDPDMRAIRDAKRMQKLLLPDLHKQLPATDEQTALQMR